MTKCTSTIQKNNICNDDETINCNALSYKKKVNQIYNKVFKNNELFNYSFNVISIDDSIIFTKEVNRANSIFNIGIVLNDIYLAKKIEMSIFENAIIYIKSNAMDYNMFYTIYNDKINKFIQLCKINPRIKKEIKEGQVNSNIIGFLSPSGLHPLQWKDLLDKQLRREELRNNLPTSDMYKCKRCGERKCVIEVKQTRAADEAFATIVRCCICNNMFSI